MRLRLVAVLLLLHPHIAGAATWGTWNGKTVGASSGNVSSLNAKTIGTASGNYGSWAGLVSPGGGGSYLLSEDFEGSSSCGDGSATNCQLTWTALDSPAVNFAYTTAPAPLESTKSLQVGTNSAGYEGYYHAFTPQSTVYGFLLVNHTTLVGGNEVLLVSDGGVNIAVAISNANPEWRLTCGSVIAASGDSITQGTTYYVWWDYTKGTGANAVCHLYYSTTSTKPGSPDITITNGDATVDATTAVLLSGNSTAVTLFDKVRVSTTALGNGGD